MRTIVAIIFMMIHNQTIDYFCGYDIWDYQFWAITVPIVLAMHFIDKEDKE